MKKIAFGLLLIAVSAYAGIEKLSRLGPALASLSIWSGTGDQSVTIAAGSTGVRNCLSELTFVSSSTSTLRVLNGGTTIYAMNLAAASPLIETWAEDTMCGSAATALHIKVSTGSVNAVSTQQLNYTGFTY